MEAHCREKDEENLTMKKDTQLQIETMVKATEWEKEKLAKQKAEAAERVQRATTRLAEKQKELDDRSEALEKMRKKFLASEQMVIGKDNEVIKFRSELSELRKKLFESPRRCCDCQRKVRLASNESFSSSTGYQWQPF